MIDFIFGFIVETIFQGIFEAFVWLIENLIERWRIVLPILATYALWRYWHYAF